MTRDISASAVSGPLERQVDGPDDQVLDHLAITDDGVIDRHREDLAAAVGGAATEAATGLGGDRLLRQLLPHTRHLALDALGGFEQPLEIGYRHQVLISFSAAPNTS